MKKIIALVLALALVLSVVTALADTITIQRDTTYAGKDGDAGRVYKYYKVFSASSTGNTSTGGGYDTDGTPGTVTPSNEKVAYIASKTIAEKLGSWDSTTKTWTRVSGNNWFDLKPIVNTDKFNVTWVGSGTDSDAAQAAAKWLFNKGVYEGTGTELTFAAGNPATWSATVDPGYYIIESNSGNNLIAATSNITIKEKNKYPPLKKTQSDEDNTKKVTDKKGVAVGDELEYNVEVEIPNTAAVGDSIIVYDKPTQGLTFKDTAGVVVTFNDTVVTPAAGSQLEELTALTDEIWRYQINVNAGNIGQTVIFTFTMIVNKEALIDTGRENEGDLIYNNTYNHIPVHVEYTTYFGGIKKVDSKTQNALEGVEFTLMEGSAEFKVTKTTDGYYVYDENGSSTVVTDAGGRIQIRGLDSDKKYTLIETKALPGYNMLSEPVELILTEDKGTAYADKKEADDWQVWVKVENVEGTVLPSTGGIGTTIFYILGGLLVVGAAVILVARRKAQD